MAIKIGNQNIQKSLNMKTKAHAKANLFSKLQGLSFSQFVPITFSSTTHSSKEERSAHLDVESQEILMRLKNNIEILSDKSARVEFMMGELSQILKKGI